MSSELNSTDLIDTNKIYNEINVQRFFYIYKHINARHRVIKQKFKTGNIIKFFIFIICFFLALTDSLYNLIMIFIKAKYFSNIIGYISRRFYMLLIEIINCKKLMQSFKSCYKPQDI